MVEPGMADEDISAPIVRRLSDLEQHIDAHLDAQRDAILAELRQRAATTSTADAPRPLHKVVAQGAMAGAKWGAIAVGVLGVAAQVARIWRPDLAGPIETLQQLLGGQ
jgi:hypothetical protein